MTTFLERRGVVTDEQRAIIKKQIGPGTILSVSGGRTGPIMDGIELPVSNGYRVRVQLTGADDYTVTRVFKRRVQGVVREKIHGQRTRVYCDQLSNAVYFASCFRSYDAEEWVARIA